ncbi:hypothetical protein ACUY2A_00105 [Corynebacterium pilbarense]
MHIIGAMPADDQALAAAVHTIVAQEVPYLDGGYVTDELRGAIA